MVEQIVLMDIDTQRSQVKARLDLAEPLAALETPMPAAIFGELLDLTALQRFQLAEGKLKQMVFNAENTLYVFTFCEESNGFVATRANGREQHIAARVDLKARAIKEGTGEWSNAIVQEMRIAVPFEMSERELEFFERYVAWRRKNPLLIVAGWKP